jgi:hypothetical protein
MKNKVREECSRTNIIKQRNILMKRGGMYTGRLFQRLARNDQFLYFRCTLSYCTKF